MKHLISWLGFNEDFLLKGSSLLFNPTGFTASLQKEIVDSYSFDHHTILCTSDRSESITKELNLRKYLVKEFFKDIFPKRQYQLLDTDIDKGDLQNFPIIESKLRKILQSIDVRHELYVVAGTGPTAVGMAWSTLNMAMQNRFGLYVLQKPEYTPQGKRSELKEIKPFISQFLDDTLREQHNKLEIPAEIYKDEIVEKEYEKALAYSKIGELNILILGETGCGKDHMAKFIHQNSPRNNKIYKPINCASLPTEILYSELFGHKIGAFTGAIAERKGLFEECIGGTLFLDEIGDISPLMQQSLLRALEKKEIKKLGSNEIVTGVDVRIIAATNVDLYEKCKKGEFRWDLYYRLCDPKIQISCYRNRPKKLRKAAITHYKKILEEKWNRKLQFTPEAEKMIEEYGFPGNFREIFNTLNSLFPLNIEQITTDDLPERFQFIENNIDETIDTAVKKHCKSIYKKYKYNITEATKALGYKNSTQVKNKFIELGIIKKTS